MTANIIAAIGLVVALGAAYFTWRTIPPKRELTITMRATRLLQRAGDVGPELRMVHDELGDLHDPQVVLLTVRNTGRAAIASPHFDADRPLPIALRRPILQLIQSASQGGVGYKPPPVAVDGGTLHVGPGLIHRKQLLTYTSLIDGEPGLDVEKTLPDVELCVDDSDESRPPSRIGPYLTSLGPAFVGLSVGGLGGAYLFAVFSGELSRLPGWLYPLGLGGMIVGYTAMGIGAWLKSREARTV